MRLRSGGRGRIAGWVLFFIILFSNYFQSPDMSIQRRPPPKPVTSPQPVPDPAMPRKPPPKPVVPQRPEPKSRLPNQKVEGRGELRAASWNDPAIAIEAKPNASKSTSVGTAFSVNDDGLWVTARHVTDGCDRLYLVSGTKNVGYPIKDLIQHPSSDVSIFRADVRSEPLLVKFDTLEYGQKGYHFGYPRGVPGDVYSVLMGRRVMVTKGTRSDREQVLVWAEKDSYPKNDHSLGGISGGPIVDATGAVVGVHVAGTRRRGRSYSSLPASIQYVAVKGGNRLDPENDIRNIGPYLNEKDFPVAGARLRKQRTVSQVVCQVK